VVVTDTVFSMDGNLAPLPELFALCREHRALLYLDDAHGTGVLGEGRGALAHWGLAPEPWVVQMGTFSKALGSLGGFAAGEPGTLQWLRNRARSFIFSTALPPAVAAASLAAVTLIQNDRSLIRSLWENRGLLSRGLSDLGLDTGDSGTPIIPVLLRSVEEALSLAARLEARHIYAPAIRPPTVVRPRLRLTVTAAHRPEDVERLLVALREFAGPNGHGHPHGNRKQTA
jgi:7-keto-8-aminopelargonate synthetase-like enzyme